MGIGGLFFAMELGAETEELEGEARIMQHELEREPMFKVEIGAAELVGALGRLEVTDHSGVKFGGEGVREALEIPVVVAEFGGVQGGKEFGGEVMILKKTIDFGVFFGDTEDLAGVVDGGAGVVGAIVEVGGGSEDDTMGEEPNFETETNILIRSARGGEEFDVVLF